MCAHILLMLILIPALLLCLEFDVVFYAFRWCGKHFLAVFSRTIFLHAFMHIFISTNPGIFSPLCSLYLWIYYSYKRWVSPLRKKSEIWKYDRAERGQWESRVKYRVEKWSSRDEEKHCEKEQQQQPLDLFGLRIDPWWEANSRRDWLRWKSTIKILLTQNKNLHSSLH